MAPVSRSAGVGIAETRAPCTSIPSRTWCGKLRHPDGHSSPSIWGDHLFLTSYDEKTKNIGLLAFDRKSGRLRWRLDSDNRDRESPRGKQSATATPIVDGDRVYSYFGSAGLFSHNLEGEPIWSVPLPLAKANFGSGASPVLIGDMLVIPRDDAGERRMIAVDKKTGKTLWTEELGGVVRAYSGHATPVVWKDQILLHRAGEIAAYSVSDGSRRWWLQTGSQGTGTPVISNDMLFVGAWGMEAELQDPIPDWTTLIQRLIRTAKGRLAKMNFRLTWRCLGE